MNIQYLNQNHINQNQIQTFPFHLVEPSPWPLLTSFALLTSTVSAVMYFHGFEHGATLLSIGLGLTAMSMILWFKDVILEGTEKIIYIHLPQRENYFIS